MKDIRVNHITAKHNFAIKILEKSGFREKEVIHCKTHKLLISLIKRNKLRKILFTSQCSRNEQLRDLHIRTTTYKKNVWFQISLQLVETNMIKHLFKTTVDKNISIHITIVETLQWIRTVTHSRKHLDDRREKG